MEPIGYDKKKANEAMQKKGLDFIVATSPENIFYTSGLPVRHIEPNPIMYALSNQCPAAVVVRKDAEDGLAAWAMIEQQHTWVKEFNGIRDRDDAVDAVISMVGQNKEAKPIIGIESTMPFYILDGLKKAYPGAKFEVVDDIFLGLRSVKSAEEIRRITEATRISEKTIVAMINALEEGVSELDLLKIAKITTLKEGGTGTNHITMSIGNADPETPGTDRRIKRGEMTRFDTGAVYGGYVSDVCRHGCLGAAPEDAKKTVEAVVEVQQKCIDAIKPGVNARDIDQIIGKALDADPTGPTIFPMGHGVGLNTEEMRFLPSNFWGTENMVFEPGMVFDLEFWSPYEPYGNRLIGMEDTYLVTGNGCKRITTLDRKIFEKR